MNVSMIRNMILPVIGLVVMSCGDSNSGADQSADVTGSACQTISLNDENAEIELHRVFSSVSFTQPVAMIQLPGNEGEWFVAEREGKIRGLSGEDATDFDVGDLSERVGSSGQEQGLLGIELHPNYPVVKELFVSYTGVDGNSVVSKFTLDVDQKIKLDSEQIILTQEQPFSNHNGGGIAFGPDGYLYIGFGDGGDGGDPQNNAQNTRTWLGAMLRIDVRQTPYTIPEDNPFASSAGCAEKASCPEIWAWGLRNPWRWSFDAATGHLWAGDVGQNQWEEISVLESGTNYGWRCYEGNHEFNLSNCEDRNQYQFPVAEYSHAEGVSVTGGYVYRGSEIPLLKGQYLYADFLTGHIWGVNAALQDAPPVRLINGSDLNIASFAQSRQNEIYLIDFNGGIYQLGTCS